MQAVLDEIIKTVVNLKPEDRQKVTQAVQEEERKTKTNGEDISVSPDTVWLRENRHRYSGMYVAIENGELVKANNFGVLSKYEKESFNDFYDSVFIFAFCPYDECTNR